MEYLRKHLGRLGFEADISLGEELAQETRGVPYVVTVVADKKNRERFLIRLGQGVEPVVLDVQPKARAMLLMIRKYAAPGESQSLAKMLVGHDERQLFVAAVPKTAKSVFGAMQDLKPAAVAEAELKSRVKKRKQHHRRNQARIRQGDFFFLPVSELIVPDTQVLKNEPINRGRGASHMVQLLYRRGGEEVWVCRKYPNGVTPEKYKELLEQTPTMRHMGWQRRTRNAEVYAKGRVTHREHATIVLKVWHRVFPNTESSMEGFEDMAFID
jgi:hypothetical protein